MRSAGDGSRSPNLGTVKRPFWMHQMVEYLLAILLLSQGLQSNKPMVPTLVGVLLLVNAGIAKGPLAALPQVPREVHRIVDLGLLALIVGAVLLTGDLIDSTVRYVLIGVAVVFAVIVLRSDYTTPVKRTPISAEGGRSSEIGRMAGRATGLAVNIARRRKRP